MVTGQEILERTLYASLMQVTLQLGRTLNPEDYLPLSVENQNRYQRDKDAMGDKYIYIFGVGNNQVRGPKIVPRITVDLNAYYPGEIGVEQFMIGDKDTNGQYTMYQYPFETKSSQFDIHLVAGNVQDLRTLHSIMYTALPARGYIKPFLENSLTEYLQAKGLLKTGNVFTQVSNFYDHNDQEHGLLEKVYSYTCTDGLIEETIADISPISPIIDIAARIQLEGATKEVPLHITKE